MKMILLPAALLDSTAERSTTLLRFDSQVSRSSMLSCQRSCQFSVGC